MNEATADDHAGAATDSVSISYTIMLSRYRLSREKLHRLAFLVLFYLLGWHLRCWTECLLKLFV